MLRSLLAVIAATIVGLAVSKFIEGAGLALLVDNAPGENAGSKLSPQNQLVLVGSWGLGAFFAAATALLIGRRWAPLGGLAAATVLLSALLVLVSHGVAWWAWPSAAAATLVGGCVAMKILNATKEHHQASTHKGLF